MVYFKWKMGWLKLGQIIVTDKSFQSVLYEHTLIPLYLHRAVLHVQGCPIGKIDSLEILWLKILYKKIFSL